MLVTYADLVEHLTDYPTADPTGESERYARRAIQAAVNMLPQMRRWSMYYAPVLLATSASQTTGTITFDYTGGTYERMVTLASATWPSWAAQGTLKIGNVLYEIEASKSTTVITLTAGSNPGEDVAALTEYTIMRNGYPLPTDFLSLGVLQNQTNQQPLTYVSPNEWQDYTRVPYGPSIPHCYTIMGSRDYLNTMAVYVWPYPNSAYTLQGVYQRVMRPVLITDYSTGNVTVGAASTTVTGSGTAWTSRMAGSVIRFANSTTNLPSGIGGQYPFDTERMVASVESATSLTLDAVTGTAYTAVKYRISDPIDIMEGNMGSLLLRECEKQFRLMRRLPPMEGGEEKREYDVSKLLAYESDCRSFEPVDLSGYSRWLAGYTPLRYFPFDDGN